MPRAKACWILDKQGRVSRESSGSNRAVQISSEGTTRVHIWGEYTVSVFPVSVL